MNLISINNLCFSYTSKPPFILNNININIPKGSYVSVIGPNGSSKTTLVKLMLKQLKPINGSIKIDANRVGYVPQKIESFNSQFTITVKEVLSCHANALNLNDKKQIDKFIERVNMKEFKNKLIGTLSGGQQQKIFIARALMGNPELLVLDELGTGVDHNSQEEIYGLIKELNKRKGITVLSVEHDLKLALDYSTHILELHEGKATLYTIDEYKNVINNGTLFTNRKVE